MAVSEGHQCQPSLLKPLAIAWPDLPSGTGGMHGLLRRIRRIARQAGNAHHAVVLRVVRLERA